MAIGSIVDQVHDDVCTRCLIPSLCWRWDDTVRCEPCHRWVYGDRQVDKLIVSDHARFGRLWDDQLLDRIADCG